MLSVTEKVKRVHRVGLALALLLTLVVAGCGSGHAQPQDLSLTAQQLVSQSEIDRLPAGTPQRLLLEWWRDIQYANLAGYVSAFQPSMQHELRRDPKTNRALQWFAGSIRAARPAIVSIAQRDATTTIYTTIKWRTAIGTKRYVTTSRPQAFVLVRLGGAWRLYDDSFVQASLPKNLQRASSGR